MGEIRVGELLCFLGGEYEAFLRQFDGWIHDALEAELAVFALGIHQAGNGTGRGDGTIADDAGKQAGLGNNVAACILVHGFSGGQRGFFAKVDETWLFRRGYADSRKPPPPRLPAAGCDDGESETGCHGGVHSVAALAQHLKPGIGGQVVHAHNHSVAGANRLLVEVGNHVLRAFLGGGVNGKRKRCADSGSQDGEEKPSIHKCYVRITRNALAAHQIRIPSIHTGSSRDCGL